MKILPLFAATLLIAGCAASLEPRRADLANLAVPPREKYPEHGAVILLRELVGLNSGAANKWFQMWLDHQVIAILDSRGLDAGNLRCARAPGAELVAFEARVRTPAGRIIELDPDDVFIDEARFGEQEDSGEVRSVALPGVEVGSLVELNCLERSDSIFIEERLRPRSPLPVERFRAELKIAGSLNTEVRAYGGLPAAPAIPEGGVTTYKLSLDDLPARLNEPDMVHWTEREPYWIYRTLSYHNGSWHQDYLRTWSDWVRRTDAAKLNDLAEGAPPAPDVSKCQGAVPCIAEALWTAAQGLAGLRGTDNAHDLRKLKEAFAGGRVTASERAALLTVWLRAVGVPAQLGFAEDRFGHRIDANNPASAAFDTLLVRVPALPERGLEKDLWLEPRCEICKPGELSPSATGIDALTFEVVERFGRKPEYPHAIRPVIGPLAPVGVVQRTHRVVMAEDGQATIEVEDRRTGFAGQWLRAVDRDRTPRQRTADLRKRLRDIDLRALRDRKLEVTATDAEARATFAYHIPGLAAAGDDALIVPLRFLEPAGVYFDEKRETDLAVIWPSVDEDVVTLVPPAGYVLQEAPPPVEFRGSLAEVSLTAAPQADGSLRIVRRLSRRAGRAPIAEYPALREVYRAADRMRRQVAVFVKP